MSSSHRMQCKQSNPWPARYARVGMGAREPALSEVEGYKPNKARQLPVPHSNSGFVPLLSRCDRLAFANLLPPHRVVQTFLIKQLRVPSKFNDASTLQHVNSVGVHHRRQPMRNQNRDRLLIRRDFTNRAA